MVSLWRRANARNIRLYYPYWQDWHFYISICTYIYIYVLFFQEKKFVGSTIMHLLRLFYIIHLIKMYFCLVHQMMESLHGILEHKRFFSIFYILKSNIPQAIKCWLTVSSAPPGLTFCWHYLFVSVFLPVQVFLWSDSGLGFFPWWSKLYISSWNIKT